MRERRMGWTLAAGVLLLPVIGVGGVSAQQPGDAAGPVAVAQAPAAARPGGVTAPASSAQAVEAITAREAIGAPLVTNGAAAASDVGTARRHSRAWNYAHDLFGVGAIVGVAAAATMDQVQSSPPGWGGGAAGFGRRAASRGGQLFVQESVRHGIAAVMNRSTEYQRCACTDFGGRVENAVVETVTDRDALGNRGFSVARFAGSFAGSFAPKLWRPDVTTASALRDGAAGLVFTAAGNLLSEYIHWPHSGGDLAARTGSRH